MSAVLSDPVTAKTVSCCRCMDSFLQRDMLCGTQTPAQDLLRDRRWALARSTPCLLFLMTSMGYSDRPWNSSCLQAERSAAGAGKSLSREPGADIMSFCARMEATPLAIQGAERWRPSWPRVPNVERADKAAPNATCRHSRYDLVALKDTLLRRSSLHAPCTVSVSSYQAKDGGWCWATKQRGCREPLFSTRHVTGGQAGPRVQAI